MQGSFERQHVKACIAQREEYLTVFDSACAVAGMCGGWHGGGCAEKDDGFDLQSPARRKVEDSARMLRFGRH